MRFEIFAKLPKNTKFYKLEFKYNNHKEKIPAHWTAIPIDITRNDINLIDMLDKSVFNGMYSIGMWCTEKFIEKAQDKIVKKLIIDRSDWIEKLQDGNEEDKKMVRIFKEEIRVANLPINKEEVIYEESKLKVNSNFTT